MSEFPTVEEKRFWPFRLNEVFTPYSHQVLEFCEGVEHPKELADQVIREVEYPLDRSGRPTDRHQYNAYTGKYKFCVERKRDYWDTGDEVASTKIADCEGSSIFFVTCCGSPEIKWRADRVYEVFGVVRDADTNDVLGGHGWSVASWGGNFRLVESTLDVPPEEYPAVENIREPHQQGNWIYDPYAIFNWSRFEEVKDGMFSEYFKLSLEEKETREKYEALEKAWDLPVTPLRLEREQSVWSKIWKMIGGGW